MRDGGRGLAICTDRGIHTRSEQEGVKILHLKFPIPDKCCIGQGRREERERVVRGGSPDISLLTRSWN